MATKTKKVTDKYKPNQFVVHPHHGAAKVVRKVNKNVEIFDENGEKINDDRKTTTKNIKNINIGKIPIMVHSTLCILNKQPDNVLSEMGECPFDQGGYFIISGKEKTIISQERITTNKIFIEESKQPEFNYNGLIRCTSKENSLFPKTINFASYSDEYMKGIKQNSIVLKPNLQEPKL